MDEFYGRIGSVLKHSYEGYTAWILSGDMVSLKKVADKYQYIVYIKISAHRLHLRKAKISEHS